MQRKVTYIVFVDCKRDGSYMNHVNGFISGLQADTIPFNVYGVGLQIEDGIIRPSLLGYFPKVVAYVLLDIMMAVRIMLMSKKNIYILRPYRYTVAVYLAAALRKIKLVQENNGVLVDELRINGHHLQSRLYYALESVVLNIPDLHICVSSGIMSYYRSRNPRGAILTLSNGFDMSKQVREFNKSYRDGLNLLFIGKLTPWQGLSEFMEYLIANPTKRVLSLTIVGDGVERQKIENLSAELSFNVNFHGWCEWEDILEISINCNIGIIPRITTNVSGSPLKLLDYIALGMPVLSTKSDGVMDVLGKSALMLPFNYNHPDSLELTYKTLCESKNDYLADEAKFILEEYSWKNHVRTVLKRIEKLD